jgi:hypothetical protein
MKTKYVKIKKNQHYGSNDKIKNKLKFIKGLKIKLRNQNIEDQT